MERLTKFTIGLCCCILLSVPTFFLMGANLQQERSEHATLRIYNRGYYAGVGTTYAIKINGQIAVKRLKSRSWVEIEVPVGTLTLETIPEMGYPSFTGKSYSMQTEAGKQYYLEAVFDYDLFTSTMHLVLRDKNRAEAEMKRLKQENNVLQKID